MSFEKVGNCRTMTMTTPHNPNPLPETKTPRKDAFCDSLIDLPPQHRLAYAIAKIKEVELELIQLQARERVLVVAVHRKLER